MHRNVTVHTAVALAFIATTPSVQAGHGDDRDTEKYSVVEIELPSDPNCLSGFWHSTTARRMNERGEVVGHDMCVIATGDETAPALTGGSNGFRWHRALGATILPALSADSLDTFARDINESGTTIGWENRRDFTWVPPVWPRAGGASLAFEVEACDVDFGAFAVADGINDRGDMLGVDDRTDADGVCQFQVWVLKLASGEEFVGPSGIALQLNNNRVAVGLSAGRAMRWSPETGEVVLYADPSFQSSGIAYSVNDRNEAVGNITHFDGSCAGVQTATFWAANAQPTTLNSLGGDTQTFAYAINNRSEVVGYSYRQSTCEYDPVQSRAVIWEGTRAVDLNSLVPKRFAREFQLSQASGINDRGQIVVRGVRRGEPKAPCPRFDYDTGEPVYNDSVTCQNEYSFLLTPKHDRR